MKARITIGPCQFDALTLARATEAILARAREIRSPAAFVVTPNLDHLQRLAGNPVLAGLYGQAAFSLADGMPVIWLSRLAGTPLPERVSGADIMPALCRKAGECGMRVFLLGGGEGIAQRAADRLAGNHPGLRLRHFYPPFGFERDQAINARIVAEINAFKPNLLFVGVGSPKQELWMIEHCPELEAGVCLGVGTSIEFIAGSLRRAPVWMQRTGLEWLFRLAMEPRRLIPRYSSNLRYLLTLAAETARGRIGNRLKPG